MTKEPGAVPIDELLTHSVWVRRLARQLVQDESRADDIVQQTWLAALRSPPRERDSVRSWLSSVVRNFARLGQREEVRRRGREERRRAGPGGVPSEDELLERVEMQQAVVQAVATLDEPYRHTVLLRYFQDLGPREIARRLDVPEATVKTRLRRALAQLRTRLDARFRDRKEWCLALIPLAALSTPAAPVLPLRWSESAATTAAGVGGALLSGKKIVAVAAGIALLLLAVPLLRNRDDPGGASQLGNDLGAVAQMDAEADTTAAGVDTPLAAELNRSRTGISGTVWLEAAGNPAAGATVEVWPWAGRPGDYLQPLATVHSNVDGSFAIDGVDAASYRVRAWAPGHELPPNQQPVVVPDDGWTTGLDLVLEAGVRLTGRVHRTDGERDAIAGAEVVLSSGRTTEADASGRYAFDGVILHDLAVLADAPGFCSRIFYLSENHEPEFTLDIPLESGGVVMGTVTNEDGDPVAGASVRAGRGGGSRSWFHQRGSQTLTDADGKFVLDGVPRGSALSRLDVTTDDYAPGLLQNVPWPTDGGPIRCDVVLGPGATVYGVVVAEDEPVAGARVWAGWGNRVTHTDADGRFSIPGLTKRQAMHGYLEVGVTCAGYCPAVGRYGWDLATGGALTVGLGKGVAVEGWLRDEEGQGVAGTVSLSLHGRGVPGTYPTDERGRFVVPHVPQGSGWVSIGGSAPGHGSAHSSKLTVPLTEPLILTLNQQDRDAGAIAGTVLDARTGDPIQAFNVRIGMLRDRPSGGGGWYLDSVGVEARSRQGTFEIAELDTNTWNRVIVRAPGYVTYTVPEVAVLPVEDVDPANLVIRMKPSVTLEGTVIRRGDASPVPGARVLLVDWSGTPPRAWPQKLSNRGGVQTTQTDAEGRFSFDSPGAGRPGLVVEAAGYARTRVARIDPHAGSLRVVLEEGASLRGNLKSLAEQHHEAMYVNVEGAFKYSGIALDASGEFRLDDLPAGTFEVQVVAGVSYVRRAQVELVAGEETEIHFDGGTGHVLEGQVWFRESPAPGAEVHISGAVSTASVNADDEGRFRAGDLARGTYRVWVSHYHRPEPVPGRINWPLRAVEHMEITLDANTQPVRIDLPTAEIRGTWPSADGDYQAQIKLFRWTEPDSLANHRGDLVEAGWRDYYTTNSDGRGSFRMGCMPAGRYLLRAGNTVVGPFDIADGEMLDGIEIVDAEETPIRVMVFDESGDHALAGSRVELCNSDGLVLESGDTDADGTWQGNALPSCSLVRVTARNRATISHELDSALLEEGRVRIAYPASPTVRLRLVGPGAAELGSHPTVRLISADRPFPTALAHERGRRVLAYFDEADGTELVLGMLTPGTWPVEIELYRASSTSLSRRQSIDHLARSTTFQRTLRVPDSGEVVVDLHVD